MMKCGDAIVLKVAGWDPMTIRCERESGHPGPHCPNCGAPPVDDGSYCGCCGDGPIPDTAEWCRRCVDHVSDDGPPWERTWSAQHGEPCLFQV
jgi:predicted amidophosphoribosyltransferase